MKFTINDLNIVVVTIDCSRILLEEEREFTASAQEGLKSGDQQCISGV